MLEQKSSLGLEEAAPGFSPGPSLGGKYKVRGKYKEKLLCWFEKGKMLQTDSVKQL